MIVRLRNFAPLVVALGCFLGLLLILDVITGGWPSMRRSLLVPLGALVLYVGLRKRELFVLGSGGSPHFPGGTSTTILASPGARHLLLALLTPLPVAMFALVEAASLQFLLVSLAMILGLYGTRWLHDRSRMLRVDSHGLGLGPMRRAFTIEWRFVAAIGVYPLSDGEDSTVDVLGVRVTPTGRHVIDKTPIYGSDEFDFRVDPMGYEPADVAHALNEYWLQLKEAQTAH